jgi:hypothetical protein
VIHPQLLAAAWTRVEKHVAVPDIMQEAQTEADANKPQIAQ